jgi:hypothetical protein
VLLKAHWCWSGVAAGSEVLVAATRWYIRFALEVDQLLQFPRRGQCGVRRRKLRLPPRWAPDGVNRGLRSWLLLSTSTIKNLVFAATVTTICSLTARFVTSCSPARPAFEAIRSRSRTLLFSAPLAPAKTPRPPTRYDAISPMPVNDRTSTFGAVAHGNAPLQRSVTEAHRSPIDLVNRSVRHLQGMKIYRYDPVTVGLLKFAERFGSRRNDDLPVVLIVVLDACDHGCFDTCAHSGLEARNQPLPDSRGRPPLGVQAGVESASVSYYMTGAR